MAEVILALDLPGPEARRLLDRLPELRWVKIGAILFTREGPSFVRDLLGRGLRVFLDLKWHDIPSTVAGAVEAARDLGVTMATVHALGGVEMMEAAAHSAGESLELIGVTVLTSHTAANYAATVGRSRVALEAEASRLASAAVRAGLRGVVCSAQEIAVIRPALAPHNWIVVPGIRRAGDALGGQQRTATAGEAARAGATHLVVGRPILTAPDPPAALRQMVQEADLGPPD